MITSRQKANPGEQVLFLGHAEKYPKLIAEFTKNILHHDRVFFVTERDYSLTESYLEEFKEGINFEEPFYLEGKIPTQQEFQDLMKVLGDLPDIPVILNTHAEWGEKILRTAETLVKGVTFISPPSIVSSEDFSKFGSENSGNELFLIADPVDAMNHKVTVDLRRFKSENKFWNEATSDPQYVKRCLDVVEIIQHALDTAKPDKNSLKFRSNIAGALSTLTDSLLPRANELYKFDKEGRIIHEATFIHHANGVQQSYPFQLSSDYIVIPNVVIGIELINVSNFNPSENSLKQIFSTG